MYLFSIGPSITAELHSYLFEILLPVFAGLYPEASPTLVRLLTVQAVNHAMNHTMRHGG